MLTLLCLAVPVSYGQDTYSRHGLAVTGFGAVGDGKTLCTGAIQNAIDYCWKKGGGEVVFTPGEYLTGTIVLKDNVTLNIQAGATILASRDENDYSSSNIISEGSGADPALICAKNARNIAITGNGSIHGQARRYYEDLMEVDPFISDITENARQSGIEMKRYYKTEPVVRMVIFEECSGVSLTETSFIESCGWTLHFKWCDNVFINGITVLSSLEQGVNADGLDIDGCRDMVVSDCIIKTGDDAIVLKTTNSSGESRPCENISVTNCILTSTSTALKLGTESYNDFRHISFSNCVIRNTNRGLSIVVRDGATVEYVSFSNIVAECIRKPFFWWGNGDPIWLVVLKRSPESKVGTIRNVSFNNIMATGQGTSKIEGFQGIPLKNIELNNVHLTIRKEILNDKRADDILQIHDVDGLRMNDMELSWDTGGGTENKWRNSLNIEHVRNISLDGLIVGETPGKEGIPFIKIDYSENAFINNVITFSDSRNILKVEKSRCKNIKTGRVQYPD